MINSAKRAIFKAYAHYYARAPIELGKWQLGRAIKETMGYALFDAGGVILELDPLAVIDQRLIRGEPHDREVVEAIERTLAGGGKFIDVGANIGYFSLLAAKHAGVEVYAFEPSPRELARLHRNISHNRFTNITVFPYGLSDREETIRLNLARDDNPGMNSVLDIIPDSRERPECRFFPLAHLLAPEALRGTKLCKIDVEGFEPRVLEGMAGCMEHLHGASFVVEVAPHLLAKGGFEAAQIYRFFEAHGFRPTVSGPNDPAERNEIFTD